VIVLTPAIASFEKLLKEFDSLRNGTHPELVKRRKEHEAELLEKYAVLDKYAEYQSGIIEQQYKYEVQCAKEELEDFLFSHPE
jgi:hypothetical protein